MKEIKNINLIDSKSFSLFRFLFSLLMIPQVLSLTPSIHDLSKSTFVFHYPFLSFIDAYSHALIDYLQTFAILGAILLGLGIIPRLGALIFTLTFSYLFLIDMSFYNNHYYLWCLIGFLFVVTDTHKSISIIDLVRKNYHKEILITNHLVFASLFVIVYFYGGLVKLNGDWLQGYPMRLLTASRMYPFPDLLGFLMSYVGIIFDLSIGFLLWYKPKAFYTLIPFLVFHLSNYFIFNIGEFPLVMIAAWFVFIPIAQLKVPFNWIRNYFVFNFRYSIYIAFFTIQLLFPVRSLLIKGTNAWHRQGYFFSWRMMLNNHEPILFQFLVDMPDKKDQYKVDFSKLLTYRQFSNTYHDPYFIWLLAQKLKADAEKKYGSKEVHVYCKSLITLNQHPAQDLILEQVDLGNTPYYFFSNNKFITNIK